ncbi:MAG: hypothetical protein ABI761_18370 [Saprospiraceae bacterium]
MREAFLVIHFIGLAMGLGTGIAFIFLGQVAGKLPPEERGKFMLNILHLSRMGQIGLTLLVISGLYLITPYWKTLSVTPTLIAKLSLVIVLIGILIYSNSLVNKARAGNPMPYLIKVKSLGPYTLLIVLSIVILAVLTFH